VKVVSYGTKFKNWWHVSYTSVDSPPEFGRISSLGVVSMIHLHLFRPISPMLRDGGQKFPYKKERREGNGLFNRACLMGNLKGTKC
jgi:hypothetical protein